MAKFLTTMSAPRDQLSAQRWVTYPARSRQRRASECRAGHETRGRRQTAAKARAKKQAAPSFDQPKPFATQGHPSFERPPSDLARVTLIVQYSIAVEAEASRGRSFLRPSRRGVRLQSAGLLVVAPHRLADRSSVRPEGLSSERTRLSRLPQILLCGSPRVVVRQPKLSGLLPFTFRWDRCGRGLSNNESERK